MRIVGEKLGLSKFATAQECFQAMDKDGGGTLSRKEIAVGLLQVCNHLSVLAKMHVISKLKVIPTLWMYTNLFLSLAKYLE